MEEITQLNSRENGGWWAVVYNLHVHYGYETILRLFDRFVSEFEVRVERIAKAKMVGQAHSVDSSFSFETHKIPAIFPFYHVLRYVSLFTPVKTTNKLDSDTLFVTLETKNPLQGVL